MGSYMFSNDSAKIEIFFYRLSLNQRKCVKFAENKIIMAKDGNYIRFDWAMKHMLRDKANFGILEGLISVLLKDEVKIEEILESESNQEEENDKFNRVDIKAKNSKGQIIIVEVQLTRQLYYLQRILYGTCKAITEHINIGDKYDQVKKVYSISILYCDYGQGDDYIYHGITCFKGIHTGNDLMVNTKEDGVIVPHLPREVFPEYFLLRVNQFSKIPENPLDEWMEYLKTGMVKENTRVPSLQQVREKLRVMSMSVEEKRAYDIHMDNIMVQNDVLDTARDEGREEGRAEGLEEGRKEGRKEGLEAGKAMQNVITAKKMLEAGIATEIIKQVTGLSIDDLDPIS